VHDLRDRGFIQRAQPDLSRARRFQPVDRLTCRIWQFPRAQRQQPADRVRSESSGQCGQGASGSGVGPLQVIDDDQQRRTVCGFLDGILQLAQ